MVSQLKTFSNKVCKMAAQKNCFGANFALLSRIFLVSVLLSISVERFFFPLCNFFCVFQIAELKKIRTVISLRGLHKAVN